MGEMCSLCGKEAEGVEAVNIDLARLCFGCFEKATDLAKNCLMNIIHPQLCYCHRWKELREEVPNCYVRGTQQDCRITDSLNIACADEHEKWKATMLYVIKRLQGRVPDIADSDPEFDSKCINVAGEILSEVRIKMD